MASKKSPFDVACKPPSQSQEILQLISARDDGQPTKWWIDFQLWFSFCLPGSFFLLFFYLLIWPLRFEQIFEKLPQFSKNNFTTLFSHPKSLCQCTFPILLRVPLRQIETSYSHLENRFLCEKLVSVLLCSQPGNTEVKQKWVTETFSLQIKQGFFLLIPCVMMISSFLESTKKGKKGVLCEGGLFGNYCRGVLFKISNSNFVTNCCLIQSVYTMDPNPNLWPIFPSIPMRCTSRLLGGRFSIPSHKTTKPKQEFTRGATADLLNEKNRRKKV